MKKKVVSVLVMLAMASMMIAGCGSSSGSEESSDAGAGSSESSGDKKEFIFVCPIVGLEYWNMCSDGIEAADSEMNVETQIVGPTDSTTFTTEIVSYMESAISSMPDGILCYAGLETFPNLLQQAADQNIPVITIDSDCSDTTNRVAYVGTDPYNAGYSSGEAMIEATGGEGKVAVLTSSVSSEKEQEEIEAFEDAIADTDLEVVAMEETNADLATGVEKMEALIQTYPDLTAVLGTSAYDVQAAAKVKVEYGLDDLHLIGYDDQEETLNYIRDGVIDAIIVQNPYEMGYQGVKLLSQYIDGETLESDSYDTGTVTVTEENVDSYRDQ